MGRPSRLMASTQEIASRTGMSLGIPLLAQFAHWFSPRRRVTPVRNLKRASRRSRLPSRASEGRLPPSGTARRTGVSRGFAASATMRPPAPTMEDIYCFGGNPLDRASERRNDREWIAALLGDRETRILPLRDLKPFTRGSAAPALDWQPVEQWRDQIASGAMLRFLGPGDGTAPFA